MIRLSQGLREELRELAIYSPPGEVPYETAMYQCGLRILCVAAPQSIAERIHREVEQVPYERLDAAFHGDEIIHDALGIVDDAIVWMIDLPDRRGVPKTVAELTMAQQFLTRAAAWGEPGPQAPPAPGEPQPPLDYDFKDLEPPQPPPLDDAGNPEPDDLGELDMGEHDEPGGPDRA